VWCHRWCRLFPPIPLPLCACPPSMLIISHKNIFWGWLWDLWGYPLPPPSQTLVSLEEKIELMLEKACPQEAEGIKNKILLTHCDGWLPLRPSMIGYLCAT
jgi:hypothetical protein